MPLQFIPVTTPEQIASLAALASEIWHEYFPGLISAEQIGYMVEKFQSEPALRGQIQEQGYEYYFLVEGGNMMGYAGIRTSEGKLFLSKLYLRREFRGKGHAGEAFRFLDEVCRARNLSSIWLTVNRHNGKAIAAYLRNGFVTVRGQVAPIGRGYVMDDFVMEKVPVKG